MSFTFGFKKQFAVEFANFPTSQQDKVLEFASLYETHGLLDFSKYPGKIAPSWSGSASSTVQAYAMMNHLWHYHIGIPSYTATHPKYSTSDWVLHFQWVDKGKHIDLLDLYSHWKSDGTFYMPPASYLA